MTAPVKNFITITYSAGSDPVEIHHGVAVTHAHPKHWHDEYLICAITGGGGYTEYGGDAHFTPPGSLFLLPPGEVHSNYATDEGCSYSNVYLPVSRLARVLAQIDSRQTELAPFVVEDHVLHGAFLAFCRQLEQAASQLQRDASYSYFFQLVLGRFAGAKVEGGTKEQRAVQTAREFLDAHFDQEIALEHLAQLTGLSPFHLNRTFRRQVGLPPHAYQIQLRVARAKAMLRDGWPIAEVAHRAGFADQSHFTRCFKRAVGVTPGQFVPDRKNIQYLAFAAD
jgi:AraC-like DNA-binding protein